MSGDTYESQKMASRAVVKVVVNLLTWVQGTKLRPFAKTAHVFNH